MIRLLEMINEEQSEGLGLQFLLASLSNLTLNTWVLLLIIRRANDHYHCHTRLQGYSPRELFQNFWAPTKCQIYCIHHYIRSIKGIISLPLFFRLRNPGSGKLSHKLKSKWIITGEAQVWSMAWLIQKPVYCESLQQMKAGAFSHWETNFMLWKRLSQTTPHVSPHGKVGFGLPVCDSGLGIASPTLLPLEFCCRGRNQSPDSAHRLATATGDNRAN